MEFGLRKIAVRMAIIVFWIGVLFLFIFASRIGSLIRQERSITVFTFPLLLDAQRLSMFELQTGIKLHIHYYENNDELLAKMRATKQHGYDVVFPSDYSAQLLINGGHLQKLDRSKLDFWDRINKKLLGHYFDFRNEHSVPFQWEVYGIGYDKSAFGDSGPPKSWGLIFDPKIAPARIGMINNAREVISLAAFYLFGRLGNLSVQDIKRVKKLILEQKKRVGVYTDLRANYLLEAKSCAVAVCTAGDIWRFDAPGLDFFIPQEGSFVVIDSACITAQCTKTDMVYQFLNFLYTPDVMEHNTALYQLWPATVGVPVDKRGEKLMHNVLKRFDKFFFFQPEVSEKQMDEIWITLKGD